jgi:hypothetical protein
MKSYEGETNGDVYVVEKLRRAPLPPRNDLRDHSPTGFEWGYGGSGPAQLALAILADLYGDAKALAWYQPFKWRVIAQLKRDEPWTLSAQQVNDVLAVLEAEGRGMK